MQHQGTARFSTQARNEAQFAYAKAMATLQERGELAPDDKGFLLQQRPRGIDEVGRIVLEFATPADSQLAGERAALSRLSRVLVEEQLASGVERTTSSPPRKEGRRSVAVAPRSNPSCPAHDPRLGNTTS